MRFRRLGALLAALLCAAAGARAEGPLVEEDPLWRLSLIGFQGCFPPAYQTGLIGFYFDEYEHSLAPVSKKGFYSCDFHRCSPRMNM